MPKYPVKLSDSLDHPELLPIFSWQTRIRLAPKFGTTSISNYQNDQMNAMSEIEKRVRKVYWQTHDFLNRTSDEIPAQSVRCSKGHIFVKVSGKWQTIGTVHEINDECMRLVRLQMTGGCRYCNSSANDLQSRGHLAYCKR